MVEHCGGLRGETLGLRFGGMHLVRHTLRPLAVGLFVGDLVAVVLWRVIDALTF